MFSNFPKSEPTSCNMNLTMKTYVIVLDAPQDTFGVTYLHT